MKLPIIIFGMCTLFVVSTTATEEQSTPFWDMIPVIAQGKSLVQLIFGDKDGAVKTQEHFLNEGLGSSQLRSAYFLVTGEPKKALQIQGKFFSNLEGIIDGTPIVGHVKGGVHLLTGDHEHGWSALKSATSTSGAIVGGILGGPVGAIGGHFLTDAIISGTDVVLNGNQSQPHGLVDYVLNLDKLKPGDHFDVIAGMILDTTTGQKVNTKRNWFNFDRFGQKKSAESHKLQPPHENEKSGNQKTIEKSRQLDEIIEETDPKSSERGSSQIAQLTSTANRLEESNSLKYQNFKNFLQHDLTYKDLDLVSSKESSVVRNTFDGLDKFQDSYHLNQLDINSLRNKFSYLTDDEKSLITKHDFRTVNTMVKELNCFICSLAGIMKTNVERVLSYFGEKLEGYNSKVGSNIIECLETLQRKKFIKYESSYRLDSIEALYTYLKDNAKEFENKYLILDKMVNRDIGHSVVMKYKMVEGNPDPVILFVDFQYPGFLQSDIPNPYRFRSYIYTKAYNFFFVSVIELLK